MIQLITLLVGLAGALIGVAGGVLVARQNNSALLRSAREARSEERRATSYLEILLHWSIYLHAVRPVLFPGEAFMDTASLPEDVNIIRGRASVDIFASAAVQHLHEAVYDAMTVFTDMSTAATERDQTSGATRFRAEAIPHLRSALGVVGQRVDAMAQQMNRELHPAERET